MCKNNNCSNGECKTEKLKDFSIREEVRVALEENLPEDVGVTIDEIVEDLCDDEIMLDAIKLCIYQSIQRKLKEKGKSNVNVDFQVDNAWEWLLQDYDKKMKNQEVTVNSFENLSYKELLNSAKFDELIEKDIKDREESNKRFETFKEKRIYEVIENVWNIVNEKTIYSDEGDWEYPFTEEEFSFLFGLIYSFAINNNKLLFDEENYFSQGIAVINYKDRHIHFDKMIGQGTVNIASEKRIEIVEESKVIDFEEILKNK